MRGRQMRRREFISSLGGMAAMMAVPDGRAEGMRGRSINETTLRPGIVEGENLLPTEASNQLSECLTTCSEMRVPVNCIIGYTELILDNRYGEIPDDVRRVLHRVRASGLQITQAINDVFQPVLSRKEE